MTSTPQQTTRSPWRTASAHAPRPALGSSKTFDLVVVGGGLAGLSAAYHLRQARPSASIALLEQSAVGAGGTGDSTGIVAPGVGDVITALRRRHGAATAARMFAESRAAVELTIDLIRDEGLDCDLEVNGQLVCARTAGHDKSLRRQAKVLAELGFVDIPYLDRETLNAELRSSVYVGALRNPRAATIDPLRFCQTLAARLVELGVEVYEGTPVQRLRPGRPVTLQTPGGSIRAGQVVLATDGCASWRPLERSVVPLTAHVMRTAPLSAEQLASIGWSSRDSAVDCRTFFNYYRLTPDNRIMFGGGRAAVPAGIDSPDVPPASSLAAWDRLAKELVELFPGLADLPVTERWSGRIGAVVDRLPRVGPVDGAPGVWFSGGWCGHGIPLSVAAGARLAQQLTGGTGPAGADLPWHREKAPMLPVSRLGKLGLSGYLASLDAADRVLARASSGSRSTGHPDRPTGHTGGALPASVRGFVVDSMAGAQASRVATADYEPAGAAEHLSR